MLIEISIDIEIHSTISLLRIKYESSVVNIFMILKFMSPASYSGAVIIGACWLS